jgi:hypothetical protein
VLLVLSLPLTLFAAVFVHELGHAIVGQMVGFKLHRFAAWPLCLDRFNGSWRLTRLSGLKGAFSGFVQAYPLTSRQLRMRVLAFSAAGPGISVVFGATAALAAAHLEAGSADLAAFSGWVSLWSFLIAFVSVLPTRTRNIRSDGRSLLELVGGKPGLLREYAIFSLISSNGELRPREWDKGLVELALDTSIEVSPPLDLEATLQFVRYQRSADLDDIDEARAALGSLLRQGLPHEGQLMWEWESAWFHAFSLKDIEGARKQQCVAAGMMQEGDFKNASLQIDKWKVEAAIAALEGRFCDARLAASEALSCATSDRSYPAALVRALESDISQLINEQSVRWASVAMVHAEKIDPAKSPTRQVDA